MRKILFCVLAIAFLLLGGCRTVETEEQEKITQLIVSDTTESFESHLNSMVIPDSFSPDNSAQIQNMKDITIEQLDYIKQYNPSTIVFDFGEDKVCFMSGDGLGKGYTQNQIACFEDKILTQSYYIIGGRHGYSTNFRIDGPTISTLDLTKQNKICDKIPETTQQICNLIFESVKNNKNICSGLSSSVHWVSWIQGICYSIRAESESNIDLCDLPESDTATLSCYIALADIKEDDTVCDRIPKENEMKYLCYNK